MIQSLFNCTNCTRLTIELMQWIPIQLWFPRISVSRLSNYFPRCSSLPFSAGAAACIFLRLFCYKTRSITPTACMESPVIAKIKRIYSAPIWKRSSQFLLNGENENKFFLWPVFVWGLIENTLQSWDSINHIPEIVIIFFPTQQINTNKLPEYIRHPYSKLQQNWILSPWGGKYNYKHQALLVQIICLQFSSIPKRNWHW